MINDNKSLNVTFTLNKWSYPEVSLNNKTITDSVKYLGMQTHNKNIIKQVTNRPRKLYWLIGGCASQVNIALMQNIK